MSDLIVVHFTIWRYVRLIFLLDFVRLYCGRNAGERRGSYHNAVMSGRQAWNAGELGKSSPNIDKTPVTGYLNNSFRRFSVDFISADNEEARWIEQGIEGR